MEDIRPLQKHITEAPLSKSLPWRCSVPAYLEVASSFIEVHYQGQSESLFGFLSQQKRFSVMLTQQNNEVVKLKEK